MVANARLVNLIFSNPMFLWLTCDEPFAQLVGATAGIKSDQFQSNGQEHKSRNNRCLSTIINFGV